MYTIYTYCTYVYTYLIQTLINFVCISVNQLINKSIHILTYSMLEYGFDQGDVPIAPTSHFII